jgi:hypothetical protein
MSFTLGCDPELICKSNGRFVPAHNYFKSQSSFGLDGCESTAEIRPGYSESPLDLTSKIYQILEYGHSRAENLEFYSGHFVDSYAIGGHIHVSTQPTPLIIEGLDTVLGSLSNTIDDKEQRKKRESTGYGKKGAYRRKSYGFEYRRPGSFLISPTVTLVTLTLAKLAVWGTLNFNLDWRTLKQRQRNRNFLKNIKSYLQTIPDDCHEGIKQLDQLLLLRTINWNCDILPNWGLRRAA